MTDTWTAVLEDFRLSLVAAGRSASTRRLRMMYARLFAESTDAAPSAVTLSDLEAFLGNRPDWKPSTREVVTACLRNLFGWMQRTGRRADNPAADLPRVLVPRGLPRPCPDETIVATMATVPAREALMIRLGGELGLRRGEIATVRGDALAQTAEGWTLTVTGKGGKTRRVPVDDDTLAAAVLERGQGWTFPGKTDGHLRAETVGLLMSRALPDKWTCHTLRHRFASVAYAADHDIRAVQELLGHASVATTQIYTRVPDAAKRKAAGAARLVPAA